MNAVLFWFLAFAFFLFATVQILLLLGRTTQNHAFEFYGRALASFIALALCATYGTIASACLTVVGYGGLGQWTTARAFKWSMYAFTGLWCTVDDEQHYITQTRPAVFVGNHQSELDVLAIGHIFPKYISVTAKKSLKYIPVLGWYMALSKTVFIERTSREQAVAAFGKAAQQMHSHQQSVFIFPEGTRSYSEKADMLPFKKGAFHLAVQAQVPIVPVVVANYSNILNVRRKIFTTGSIPIKALEPVETKGKTKEDVDALLELVRSRMQQELEVMTARARQAGVAVQSPDANGAAKSSGVDTRYNAAAA